MLTKFLQRLKMSRAFKKMCSALNEHYGVPDWYTEGQVATVAELSKTQWLLEFALPVLTEEAGSDRDNVRDEFSRSYLDGDPTHNARDVVKRFVSIKKFNSSADFTNDRTANI